jgi:DNA-binding LacI/PurR family transcriptional regulator
MTAESRPRPKYQALIDTLTESISSGKYPPGHKLPSEAMLVKQFGTSRITVGRAMRELSQRGLIERVAGSGSYVRGGVEPAERNHLVFGLLIPDLGETEIFEPICQGIASAPEAGEHAMLWGHVKASATTKSQQALQLAEQYVARKVSGVFFAPLEYEADARSVNRRILAQLAAARIPVVLLDRRPEDSVECNRPDLVGLNNRQAAFVATEHLIRLGCRRIGFMAYHGSAATIRARIAGYREALSQHGLHDFAEVENMNAPGLVHTGADAMRESEAYVCVNDRVAGELMHALLSTGIRIPDDVRIVGIDDVHYARLLPVPLTTVHQPCRDIGATALSTMLERIDRPHLPARDILLDGELIVRRSCGADTSSTVVRVPEES